MRERALAIRAEGPIKAGSLLRDYGPEIRFMRGCSSVARG